MLRIISVGVAVLALAGCGNSPTSPVPRTAPTTAVPPASQAASRPVELRGPASKLAGACPTLTFAVSGTLVSTDASTTFSGDGCASLADDTFVTVVGTPNTDGSVTATSVRVASAPAPVVSTQGVVSALAGTCPSVTFTIGQLDVATSPTTTFSGGMCSAIANGSVVTVQGTAQSGGAIAATRVTQRR